MLLFSAVIFWYLGLLLVLEATKGNDFDDIWPPRGARVFVPLLFLNCFDNPRPQKM